MDLVLEILDEYALDDLYAKLLPLSSLSSKTIPATPSVIRSTWQSIISVLPTPERVENSTLFSEDALLSGSVAAWPRDYIPRQLLSLTVVTLIGIHLLYFIFAGLSYLYIFNHNMMRHPRFLPNQVRKEIMCSLKAFPGMIALTLPFFLSEVRGWTRLYDNVNDFGWTYLFFSMPLFLVFTDYCIYWIHRWLHLPFFYKRLHKPHHKWIIPTPFASHAFHPVDGFAQSVPYHMFIYIFPMQRHVYLLMFVLVNCWTIFIHDSDMITGHPLEKVINGPAHHTLHHMYFVCNYGQYFTMADRVGGSYRHPDSSLDPLLDVNIGDKLSPEEAAKREAQKQQQGDDIAEEWEQQILGSGQGKAKTE
ncbi:hypothetical protein M422DRAFT_222861 [Sphaerobolus stellatus SS14]|nr:hypothetical protein M422DRAFT_222861 [Sphaerobolus stellatus SS14]